MAYKVSMWCRVSDYEHDGDLENEMIAWRKVGFSAGNIDRSDPDSDSPSYEVKANIDDSYIESALNAIERQLERLKGSRFKDFSEILHPYEMTYLLHQCDTQNGTDFEIKYKDRIEELCKLYKEI